MVGQWDKPCQDCLLKGSGWAGGEENDCAEDEEETEHEGTGGKKMISVKILLSCDS